MDFTLKNGVPFFLIGKTVCALITQLSSILNEVTTLLFLLSKHYFVIIEKHIIGLGVYAKPKFTPTY